MIKKSKQLFTHYRYTLWDIYNFACKIVNSHRVAQMCSSDKMNISAKNRQTFPLNSTASATKNRDTDYSVLSVYRPLVPRLAVGGAASRGAPKQKRDCAVYWGSGAAPQAACAVGAYKWRLPFVRRLLPPAFCLQNAPEDNGGCDGAREQISIII